MNNLQKDILKTLAYFDLFQYPITRFELKEFLPGECEFSKINKELNTLLLEKTIFQADEFYSIQNNPKLAENRRKGNLRAIDQFIIARRAARILYCFPFVRVVAVSGSLSKHFAAENSDIDFFIITSSNRLWIARTLMHFLKKLSFILHKQHWFCMNYYVDESALKISEENIFTAMEIVTLIPMHGMNCFQQFLKANQWTAEYFPGKKSHFTNVRKDKKITLKILLEKVLSTPGLDKLERWLMQLTDSRWRQKTLLGKVNDHGDKIEMLVGKHYSKPNPKNFQAKVLQQYEKAIKGFITEESKVF